MAAGLGFKTFQVGEVLLSSDVNGYLMQGVLVFANAAARDAAITSPQEGQCCYLKDTDAVLTYSGAAWVGFDDSNAIQNTIVDAKGDIVAASGSDTPARLAVGNNGETIVADSSTATGLRWQGDYAAGKNKIINGDFGVWQRGTSFTPPVNTVPYCVDRFNSYRDGTGSTVTISQQTFTPGTAPVAGYEDTYFLRYAQSVAGSSGTYSEIDTRLENVRLFAGQTATFSFWAKADATRVVTPYVLQVFGSGGSSAVTTNGSSQSLTTSWARYSVTINVPSISGKTIGTSSYLQVGITLPNNVIQTIETWGWQLESGSVATAFQTATGTIQGELAACQRYLPAFRGEYSPLNGWFTSTTGGNWVYNFAVPARVAPTGITISAVGDFQLVNKAIAAVSPTAITWNYGGTSTASVSTTHTAGSPTSAQGEVGFLRASTSSAFILFTGCEL